jgi:hypothetical protein
VEAVTNHKLNTTIPVTSPKVISELTIGASYNLVSRAENIYGFSGYSNIQTATLKDVPLAP